MGEGSIGGRSDIAACFEQSSCSYDMYTQGHVREARLDGKQQQHVLGRIEQGHPVDDSRAICDTSFTQGQEARTESASNHCRCTVTTTVLYRHCYVSFHTAHVRYLQSYSHFSLSPRMVCPRILSGDVSWRSLLLMLAYDNEKSIFCVIVLLFHFIFASHV